MSNQQKRGVKMYSPERRLDKHLLQDPWGITWLSRLSGQVFINMNSQGAWARIAADKARWANPARYMGNRVWTKKSKLRRYARPKIVTKSSSKRAILHATKSKMSRWGSKAKTQTAKWARGKDPESKLGRWARPKKQQGQLKLKIKKPPK